jgi:tetratricopeptide (TPR) repeat protein
MGDGASALLGKSNFRNIFLRERKFSFPSRKFMKRRGALGWTCGRGRLSAMPVCRDGNGSANGARRCENFEQCMESSAATGRRDRRVRQALGKKKRTKWVKWLAAGACAVALASAGMLELRAQTASPGKVRLQVIVVDTQEKAEQALARLKKGDDFGELAKEVSIDPNASSGGNVGEVDPMTLRPELRDAISTMKAGQTSGVIRVATGYVIVKVLAIGEETPGQGMGPARGAQGTGAGQGMGANRDLHLAGRGAIQYPADVAGQVLADMLFQRYPKPDGWQQDLHAICNARQNSLAQGISTLEKVLADEPQMERKSPYDAIQTHYALAQLLAYEGKMDRAVEEWEAAYKLATISVPAGIAQLTEVLGVAYLHKSEMENDAYEKPGERCLFPPEKSICYQQTKDSQKAIEYLTEYLRMTPERPDAVQVKWLLNVAYSTLGKYPAGVPAKYLVPEAAFATAPAESVPRWTDVAPQIGMGFTSMAGGVIADDFENNGLLDVVVSSYDFCQPLRYFHNNGDGTFSDRTLEAGLMDQLGGLNMIQADYNNDGCMDILVLRGAWEFPARKSLLRNNCNGTFTDVTQAAGLAEPATRTQAAVWVDVNNDGLLDLFVGSENGPSQLFLNKGDGTFEDISASSGVNKIAFTKGVAAADYDNDGYMDLYVSNLYGGNFLYHNNHNNTFTEVSEKAGVHQSDSQSFATWFFDYDNDGWPDIFATTYFFSNDETIRSYLGMPTNAATMRLYRNKHDGTFEDVTASAGLAKINMPMGANFGDAYNDGYLDIYLATGGPEYGALTPKMLLRNRDGKYFADVTAATGTGDLHKGHGVSFADLGNNGREDLLVSTGGATPGDAHQFRVYENPGNDNDWITVKLVGVKSNRAGIGARIQLTVENGDAAPRSIYRTVGSGGSFGANPIEQHIGLGKDAKIEALEIWWPASNSRQRLQSVQKNQFIEVTEFAKQYRILPRRAFQLSRGGAAAAPAVGKSAAP